MENLIFFNVIQYVCHNDTKETFFKHFEVIK